MFLTPLWENYSLRYEEVITNEWIMEGKYEIEVEDKMYPITIHLTAPYDHIG